MQALYQEENLVYLNAIVNYLKVVLKFIIFFAVLELFYLFLLLSAGKLGGAENFLGEVFASYGKLMFNSLPLVLIISTVFYFSFRLSFEKRFFFRVIPIIAAFNSLLLLPNFFIGLEVPDFPESTEFMVSPQIEQSHINRYHGYNVYVNEVNSFDEEEILSGVLFYDGSYFIDSGSANGSTVVIKSTSSVSDGKVSSVSKSFLIPQQEPLEQLQSSGLYASLMKIYFSYVETVSEYFSETFESESVIFSVLSLIFTTAGFFLLLSCTGFFFNEKEIYLLNASALIFVALAGFFVFPYYLGLMKIIQFGISSTAGKLLLPSGIVLIFSALIAFGLMQLKDVLSKKRMGV